MASVDMDEPCLDLDFQIIQQLKLYPCTTATGLEAPTSDFIRKWSKDRG